MTYTEGHLIKVAYICLVGGRYIGATRVTSVKGYSSVELAKTVNVVVLTVT